MKELISVIVPVYNAEQYLECTVNSILRQTYQYFEVILIDDGSVDKSAEICDRFAMIDERVKVIHQDNKGPSATRNRGIDEAKGTYISFVDNDDLVNEC